VRIIDRVAAALREAADDLLLCANAGEAAQWLPGVPVVHDARRERGSLVAIHSALTAAAGDGVLLVAWDMPFVSAELLRTLRARLTGGATAVVPRGPHGLEPFCAAYGARTLPTVERAIDRGELRVAGAIEALSGVVHLTVDDLAAFGRAERLFFNVNSAADLAVAERMARED
jgi:molybdopterin-guanine dinucleotide biosynthesis protein A